MVEHRNARNRISQNTIVIIVDGINYTYNELISEYPGLVTENMTGADFAAVRDRVESRIVRDGALADNDGGFGADTNLSFQDRFAPAQFISTIGNIGGGITDEQIANLGGGGGRGGAGASFVPQDPATIRENVQNYVIAVTGTLNEALINEGVATFQSKNKAAFGSRKSQQIDPWQAMKEGVRKSSAYKAIHANRPDSVDEMKWVTGRQAKLRQLGVSDTIAETLGVSSAIAGASDEALVDSAQTAQLQSTGRLLESQRTELKNQALAVTGLL